MTTVAAQRAEIKCRYSARDGEKPPISMAVLRVAELRRLFLHRYGVTLPSNDVGRRFVLAAAHHLARHQGDVRRRIRNWIELNAPWMSGPEVDALIRYVIAIPIGWRADTLGRFLRLTEAERICLCIRTIGSIDMPKAERKLARKRRQRQRERARRRDRGAKPQAESISRNKPWIAEGISRRTWYRRRHDYIDRAKGTQ